MDQFKTGDTIEHRLMPGFTIKFCARGLPSSGGRGIASPSLLLSCYADGACILALRSGRWRFRQAGCTTSDCT